MGGTLDREHQLRETLPNSAQRAFLYHGPDNMEHIVMTSSCLNLSIEHTDIVYKLRAQRMNAEIFAEEGGKVALARRREFLFREFSVFNKGVSGVPSENNGGLFAKMPFTEESFRTIVSTNSAFFYHNPFTIRPTEHRTYQFGLNNQLRSDAKEISRVIQDEGMFFVSLMLPQSSIDLLDTTYTEGRNQSDQFFPRALWVNNLPKLSQLEFFTFSFTEAPTSTTEPLFTRSRLAVDSANSDKGVHVANGRIFSEVGFRLITVYPTRFPGVFSFGLRKES